MSHHNGTGETRNGRIPSPGSIGAGILKVRRAVVPVAEPQELKNEGASEPQPPRRLVSEAFFFLLQRIDRLDEKLTVRLEALRTELRQEISGLRQEITSEAN